MNTKNNKMDYDKKANCALCKYSNEELSKCLFYHTIIDGCVMTCSAYEKDPIKEITTKTYRVSFKPTYSYEVRANSQADAQEMGLDLFYSEHKGTLDLDSIYVEEIN